MVHTNQTRRELLRNTAAAGAGALALGTLGSGLAHGAVTTISIGEVGTVHARQSGPNQWHTQALSSIFATKPVVIMKPVGPNGNNPCHIRLRNVNTDSFQYQIEEWNYEDGAHKQERFFYIAVEPGLYTLSGPGTGIEAGQVPVDTTAKDVTFQATYNQNPVVLTQPQTNNGPDAIVTRTEVSSANSFTTQLQEEEGGDSGDPTRYHKTETAGYIAFARPASGILNPVTTKFEVGLTPKAVTDEFFDASFSQTYSQTPRVMADMQTVNGPDTAELRYRSLDMNGVNFRVEEEQSRDTETNHTAERVGYVVFGQDGLIPGFTVGA